MPDASGQEPIRSPARTLLTDGLRAEVLSGLQPGDQLVVTGLSAVTDGAPVTVVPLPPGTPAIDQRG